jgi:hypothetical protein
MSRSGEKRIGNFVNIARIHATPLDSGSVSG